MRAVLLVMFVSLAAACGPGSRPGVGPGEGLCDTMVPPPVACTMTCSQSGPDSCPSGYHCGGDGFCDAQCTQGLGECGEGNRCTEDGRCVDKNQCDGLECNIVECGADSLPPTTITGTVYAPNGTLPLYGVNVYVANAPLNPMVEGAVCNRCTDVLPGAPLSKVQTDVNGEFTLTNVPAGAGVKVVITSGKWRRVVDVPNVPQCTNTALPADQTRFPRNKSEGEMPKIAITTGSADALECLIRKLGIDDAEINTDGSTGRIHLYKGNGVGDFTAGYAGGTGTFPAAAPFWNDVNKLKSYDIVMLSCEGTQTPETKPQSAMNAMKAYADFGGRAFMSHWHNVWIEGSTLGGGTQKPAVWPGVATWNDVGTVFTTPPDKIDEVGNPKGTAFADWMVNVMGSPVGQRGVIPIQQDTGRQTVTGLVAGKAEQWVFWENLGRKYPQMFQFTTPNEALPADRCGKVVFSDMHVSGGPLMASYPDSCGTGTTLSPQEKALAFMFFDIASCVSNPIL